jgi:chromosomal replication initiator protein
MDLAKFWKECLSVISRSVRGESFKTWFEPTTLKRLDDREAVVLTPKGEIHAHFLEDKYRDKIAETLREKTGKLLKVRIEFNSKTEETEILPKDISKTLNKDYTFDNFVVGPNNEFAYSACIAVAESPGKTKFNPLYVYGKSGLGKTHLIQAIGNYILANQKGKKIIFTNAVQFVDEFIKYIEIKKTDEFNKLYKTCDVLLIDDVQFLSGKGETQEVFFHIFNDLFHNEKQIVLTSDKIPKNIDALEERLVSRFQCGLTVDIQAPGFETKIAILHKKAQKNNLDLPENVIEYIAKNSSSNVREMEGYLIKLLAYSSMYKVDIDYAKALEILELKNEAENRKIYVEQVIEKVALYYGTPKEKIIKGGREKDLVLPRQAAMYLSRKLTGSSLKNIGKIFMKDHSTVIYGCNNIELLMKADTKLKNEIHQITKALVEP